MVTKKTTPKTPKPKISKALFDAKFNRQLLFDCVQAYLANRRQGTHKAKSRGQVRGTTAKMYRQKGTGRARHGDAKANLFVGGGIAFPPLPKSWRIDLPKKVRRLALAQALSLRHREGNVLLVDAIQMDAIKTKKMVEQLKKWKFDAGLIVVDQMDEKVWKSLRNIPKVDLTTAGALNAYDVLAHEKLMITQKGLRFLEKRLS